MRTAYSHLTDDELLRLVWGKQDATDLEIELAQRLEDLRQPDAIAKQEHYKGLVK